MTQQTGVFVNETTAYDAGLVAGFEGDTVNPFDEATQAPLFGAWKRGNDIGYMGAEPENMGGKNDIEDGD